MRDTVIPETSKVTRERSNRQVRYIEPVLTSALASAPFEEFLERFLKSVKRILRFITIHYKNEWG